MTNVSWEMQDHEPNWSELGRYGDWNLGVTALQVATWGRAHHRRESCDGAGLVSHRGRHPVLSQDAGRVHARARVPHYMTRAAARTWPRNTFLTGISSFKPDEWRTLRLEGLWMFAFWFLMFRPPIRMPEDLSVLEKRYC